MRPHLSYQKLEKFELMNCNRTVDRDKLLHGTGKSAIVHTSDHCELNLWSTDGWKECRPSTTTAAGTACSLTLSPSLTDPFALTHLAVRLHLALDPDEAFCSRDEQVYEDGTGPLCQRVCAVKVLRLLQIYVRHSR